MTERCRELLEQGLTDAQIAETLGLGVTTVFRYRRSLGLPSNYRRPAAQKRKYKPREPQTHWTKTARQIERDTADLNYYTTETTEFLRAIEAFRSKHRRIPTLVEAFSIAVKELGYRKDATQ